MGMYSYPHWHIRDLVCPMMDYVHTGVGFCVVRSDRLGNARASKCGTGNGKDPTLFSYLAANN